MLGCVSNWNTCPIFIPETCTCYVRPIHLATSALITLSGAGAGLSKIFPFHGNKASSPFRCNVNPMTPKEIGQSYVRAAAQLRTTGEFGRRNAQALSLVGHTYDESRTQVSEDAVEFAYQIERIASQVCAILSDHRFESDFVVHLEAFSRIWADEGDQDALERIAAAYVPVRFRDLLLPFRTVTIAPTIPWEFHLVTSRRVHPTSTGIRIRRKKGFLLLPSLF